MTVLLGLGQVGPYRSDSVLKGGTRVDPEVRQSGSDS